MTIAMIAAVARNGVIGDGERMPWHLHGDLAHFRATTVKHPCFIGPRLKHVRKIGFFFFLRAPLRLVSTLTMAVPVGARRAGQRARFTLPRTARYQEHLGVSRSPG